MNSLSDRSRASLPALTIPEEDEHDLAASAIEDPSSAHMVTPRRATDPSLSVPHHASLGEHYSRPRTRSPYSRSLLRSSSGNSPLNAPPMVRTRSLPTVDLQYMSRSPSHSPVRPPSPYHSAAGGRGTHQRQYEESYPHSSSAVPTFMDIQSIAEDQELELHTPERDLHTFGQLPPHGNTFPRSAGRRRPASPLHSQAYSTLTSSPSPLSAGARPSSSHAILPSTNPPSISASRFNEPYPTGQLSFSTGSSMPSTPTSLRSRSPSISSLETIPDSPDAEEAAVEAFNMDQIKAAAEAAEASDSDSDSGRRRQGSLEVPGTWKRGASGRKRWSVCGAERRGDFEMETIWEDGS